MALPPIAVLGGGNLGSAILTGLVDAGVRDLRVTTRSAATAARYDGGPVRAVALEDDPSANAAAVDGAGIVISGVKPAGTAELLRTIGPALAPDAVVVSLAVGTPIAPLEAALPAGAQVVRAMPNTPVRVRQGVTGLARGGAVTDAGFAAVQEAFGLLGEVVVLDDERIDRISTISGSGPAYVYLLLERFADAAVGLGFERGDAERTVAQTFAGALALLGASGESPADLRRAVTSPGGTTAVAVAVFEQDGALGRLIEDALAGALRRAEELAAR
ncbi:pyrroline-5-carboxylate reductase [Amnibacterium kyonggiense]|uniref:Pyrroline-5-carboxylate reductase n=1 Tax=Amnibacterium kyonggiense TaxID=595671 RepID=A0A4R7FRN5_9MICO|nr:pyrroline-5-carboxylate reductase [Amnibacterium kyonggiense]TDS80492.1 pyrroline-5-carboxylate reductase [Amnibacterium kyonggiense]